MPTGRHARRSPDDRSSPVRVLVTGATGFVGRWLVRELARAGHEVVQSGEGGRVDVTDRAAVAAEVRAVRPDAVAHLAGVAFGPDAARDPARAQAVNVGGTIHLVEALGALEPRPPLEPPDRSPVLLVSGSAEVYGSPRPEDLPLAETAPIAPRGPYGLSKVAQEAVAIELGRARGLRVVVTRSFNHTGPGQRPDFAIPAFASRILTARAAGRSAIRVGNVDVRRDIGDVRDVVRAYRLLLELAWKGGTPVGGLVVNVATGSSVPIRDAIAGLCAEARVMVELVPDPELIRADDPPDLRGDPTRLRELTGWRPEIPLRRTLADVLAELSPGARPS